MEVTKAKKIAKVENKDYHILLFGVCGSKGHHSDKTFPKLVVLSLLTLNKISSSRSFV
jgi:hypothetical protein